MAGDRERILSSGCTDYLAKPIAYREFLAKVDALLKDPNSDREHSTETLGGDSTRATVLVVDDDAANRKLLKALLAPLGAPVVECNGGETALDLLAKPHHGIELVILDMMMPVCDGMQVLNTLATRAMTPGLPVLVVTAHDDRSLRRRALEAGAIDFIGKPVDRVEFQAKCKTMLELSHLREDELLIRLGDAATGEISAPSEFLPQCEQHQLLPVIDRYMVDRAITLAAAGRHVCVNITGQTIGDAAVMTEIFQELRTAGPQVAGRILFEITETTALASPETAQAFSSGMHTLGCRVALDDFGTGYGTFTELRNLELDELKIDRSFVQNILDSPADERVVNTIAFVAREYGLTTVAEGVETEATLEKLAELGVDRAQGYLFGRPAPVA